MYYAYTNPYECTTVGYYRGARHRGGGDRVEINPPLNSRVAAATLEL